MVLQYNTLILVGTIPCYGIYCFVVLKNNIKEYIFFKNIYFVLMATIMYNSSFQTFATYSTKLCPVFNGWHPERKTFPEPTAFSFPDCDAVATLHVFLHYPHLQPNRDAHVTNILEYLWTRPVASHWVLRDARVI